MHREHHTKTRRFVALIAASVVAAAVACGGSVPLPRNTPASAEDYVPVPFPPRPPPVEIVPPRPSGDVVWADGAWEWEGERYRWMAGGWIRPPEGARRARWVIVRRGDGQLFFAPTRWRDAAGRPIATPEPIVAAEGERRRERGRRDDAGTEGRRKDGGEEGEDAGAPKLDGEE